MAVQGWLVQTVSGISFAISLTILFYCFLVIFKYILQQDRSRHFINLFYLMAVLLSITNMVQAVYVVFDLPKQDLPVNMSEELPLNAITVVNNVHSMCYIGFVLLTIAAYIQIMTGLKYSYAGNKFSMSTLKTSMGHTVSKRNWLFALCLFFMIVDITLEVLCMVQSFYLKPKFVLIYYLAVSPTLAAMYITIVVIIFQYMNSAANPSLAPERIKTGVQAFLYALSLATFFTVRLLILID